MLISLERLQKLSGRHQHFRADIGILGDWDWGGQNVLNARWGELAPKVVPPELMTPKLRIFYRISVDRGP